MAKRRHKRKALTTTQKYQKIQTGLKFFGVELKVLKKATGKALKAAQKIYKGIRKQLKAEGVTDLPNITQLAKEVQRQEQYKEPLPIPQEEIREPLDYADTDEAPSIDFSSPVLDEFLDTIQEAMNDLAGKFGNAPQIWNIMTQQHSEIISVFNQLKAEIGEENLAQHITNSLEYEALKTITKFTYNEAVGVLDNILDNLRGILEQARKYNESPQQFIPTTDINFDNI